MHKYDEKRAKIIKRRKKNFFCRDEGSTLARVRSIYPHYVPSLRQNILLRINRPGRRGMKKMYIIFFLDIKPGHVYTDYGY
jgi:hypothetical protein